LKRDSGSLKKFANSERQKRCVEKPKKLND